MALNEIKTKYFDNGLRELIRHDYDTVGVIFGKCNNKNTDGLKNQINAKGNSVLKQLIPFCLACGKYLFGIILCLRTETHFGFFSDAVNPTSYWSISDRCYVYDLNIYNNTKNNKLIIIVLLTCLCDRSEHYSKWGTAHIFD